MAKYPEHTKLRAVKAESTVIGGFLEWLDEHEPRIELCITVEGHHFVERIPYPNGGIEPILAEYFGIDRAALEAEKEAMLEEMRASNEVARG